MPDFLFKIHQIQFRSGELTALPQTLWLDLGRGREKVRGEGNRRRRRGKRKGEGEREGDGREGRKGKDDSWFLGGIDAPDMA